MFPSRLGIAAAAVFWFAACGSDADPDDLSGEWRMALAHAEARCDLNQDEQGRLAGSLSLTGNVWAITGSTLAAETLVLYLAPTHHEDELFSALGLAAAPEKMPAFRPAHAADRLTFQGAISAAGKSVAGTVSGALATGQAAWSMQR